MKKNIKNPSCVIFISKFGLLERFVKVLCFKALSFYGVILAECSIFIECICITLNFLCKHNMKFFAAISLEINI